MFPVSTGKEDGGAYRRLSGHVVLWPAFKVSGTSFPIRQGHSRLRSTPAAWPLCYIPRKTGGKAAAQLLLMRRLLRLVGFVFFYPLF